MDEHPAWERLRRRAEELDRRPAVETAGSFLAAHVPGNSWDEIRWSMRTLAASTTRGLERDLRALDALLSPPQQPGVLYRLIAHHANWSLEDKSDEAAAVLLRRFADMLREVLAEVEQKGHAGMRRDVLAEAEQRKQSRG